MKKYVLLSFFGHLFLFASLGFSFSPGGVNFNKNTQIETLSVSVKYSDRKSPREGIKSNTNRVMTPGNGVICKDCYLILNIGEEKSKAINEMNEMNILKRKDVLFSSYLARIKESIEPNWISNVKIYAKKHPLPKGTLETGVWVILNPSGLVIRVLVVKESGSAALDELAVTATVGQYFPNPPKNLVDKDGYCRLYWIYRVR